MKKDTLTQKIKEIAAGDKQAEMKLIDIIISQTSSQLLEIENSLNEANWVELKRLVHKMQSTFSILKMKRAKELTETLRETAGINNQASKKEIAEVIEICNQMLVELNAYLKK